MKTSLIWLLSIGFIAAAIAQDAASPKPYDDSEAYQVYSVLLPNEEVYGGTVIIQEETVGGGTDAVMGGNPSGCLFPEAAKKFKEAIADYERQNSHNWLLQRKFDIDTPYEIINSETIHLPFNNKAKDGWQMFRSRYPKSTGFVIFSAVGFNNDKTQAVVFTGSSCGWLCGAWSFHLMEKTNGKWHQAPGVSCHLVS